MDIQPLTFVACTLILGCTSLPDAPNAADPSGSPASVTVTSKPPCLGACLAGLDPYDTGCVSDATTNARARALDASGHVVAVIELRRSERCATSWARAVRVSGAKGALVASVAAAGYSNSFEHANDGEVWTDMVPVSNVCVTATGGVRRHDGLFLSALATSCAAP